jgi:hypothetical protein
LGFSLPLVSWRFIVPPRSGLISSKKDSRGREVWRLVLLFWKLFALHSPTIFFKITKTLSGVSSVFTWKVNHILGMYYQGEIHDSAKEELKFIMTCIEINCSRRGALLLTLKYAYVKMSHKDTYKNSVFIDLFIIFCALLISI